MAEKGFKRKLAAIFSANIIRCSRLIRDAGSLKHSFTNVRPMNLLFKCEYRDMRINTFSMKVFLGSIILFFTLSAFTGISIAYEKSSSSYIALPTINERYIVENHFPEITQIQISEKSDKSPKISESEAKRNVKHHQKELNWHFERFEKFAMEVLHRHERKKPDLEKYYRFTLGINEMLIEMQSVIKDNNISYGDIMKSKYFIREALNKVDEQEKIIKKNEQDNQFYRNNACKTNDLNAAKAAVTLSIDKAKTSIHHYKAMKNIWSEVKKTKENIENKKDAILELLRLANKVTNELSRQAQTLTKAKIGDVSSLHTYLKNQKKRLENLKKTIQYHQSEVERYIKGYENKPWTSTALYEAKKEAEKINNIERRILWLYVISTPLDDWRLQGWLKNYDLQDWLKGKRFLADYAKEALRMAKQIQKVGMDSKERVKRTIDMAKEARGCSIRLKAVKDLHDYIKACYHLACKECERTKKSSAWIFDNFRALHRMADAVWNMDEVRALEDLTINYTFCYTGQVPPSAKIDQKEKLELPKNLESSAKIQGKSLPDCIKNAKIKFDAKSRKAREKPRFGD